MVYVSFRDLKFSKEWVIGVLQSWVHLRGVLQRVDPKFQKTEWHKFKLKLDSQALKLTDFGKDFKN
jgi:hypothetical protein